MFTPGATSSGNTPVEPPQVVGPRLCSIDAIVVDRTDRKRGRIIGRAVTGADIWPAIASCKNGQNSSGAKIGDPVQIPDYSRGRHKPMSY